jgi:hypothetical protein
MAYSRNLKVEGVEIRVTFICKPRSHVKVSDPETAAGVKPTQTETEKPENSSDELAKASQNLNAYMLPDERFLHTLLTVISDIHLS